MTFHCRENPGGQCYSKCVDVLSSRVNLGVMPPRRISPRSQFAANLRAVRLQRKMTQEALAARSGLHRTYVGSVERGERNISIDNMESLAKALDIEIADLLRGPREKT